MWKTPMVANGRSALVTWRLSNSRSELLDDFGSIPRYSSLCSIWRTTISLFRPCPWTMVPAGNLGPMYFLDSVNMDVPVVAKQFKVGMSYSGSMQFSSVPKKHLNIPNVVPQYVLPIVPLLRKVRRGQSMQLVWMTIA